MESVLNAINIVKNAHQPHLMIMNKTVYHVKKINFFKKIKIIVLMTVQKDISKMILYVKNVKNHVKDVLIIKQIV